MKKSIIIIVVLVIVGVIAWNVTHKGDVSAPNTNTTENVAETATTITKVSNNLSQYKNEELGFSVSYPAAWMTEASPSGVLFTVPTTTLSKKANTINKLQVSIDVVPGNCSFPQVTTISERDSLKVKDALFNMIAMSNSAQGRKYFNRMYSTAKQSVCYLFNFASISNDPSNKGYTAADITSITAANKEAIAATDAAYKEVIKSFTFVVSPDGDNEALHPTAK